MPIAVSHDWIGLKGKTFGPTNSAINFLRNEFPGLATFIAISKEQYIHIIYNEYMYVCILRSILTYRIRRCCHKKGSTYAIKAKVQVLQSDFLKLRTLGIWEFPYVGVRKKKKNVE